MAQNLATPGTGRSGIKYVMVVPLGVSLDQGISRQLHVFVSSIDFLNFEIHANKIFKNLLELIFNSK